MKTSNTPPSATRRVLSTARLSFPLASAITALFASQTIHAANIWDGGAGTGSWDTPSNWDNDSVPSANATLTFAGNVQGFTTNDTTADRQYNGFLFTNNGTGGNTNAFTLAGNRITLGGNITTTANTAGATITDSISLDMILDGNRTITTNQQSAIVQHNLTSSGIISSSGNFSLTKAGDATLTLSGANTYTGATTINAGTLTLSGNRTATAGAYTLSGAGTQTLNIQGGNYGIGGSFIVGNSGGTATVNHSAGIISSVGGFGILMSNGASTTSIYNLSGGELTSPSIAMGPVSGSSASPTTSTIAVSGGALSATTLRVGRWNDGINLQNTTNTFTQTAGSTSVTNLGLGSSTANLNAAGPHIANLNLTGGTFSATNFASLSAGGAATVTNANSSFIHIGGTAQVTLGAFPTARGTNSTATITFDSGATGFLAPAADSTTYMPAGTFTNAYLTTNGANFNVGTGKNITIGQVLQDAVSPAAAGTLTKSGAGTLTLTGVNSYTGATTVLDGTLTLSGNRTVNTTGGYTVAGVGTQTLNIQDGNYGIGGNFIVGQSGGTSTVNHSAGIISVGDNAIFMGNSGSSTSFYNLNGGELNAKFIVMGFASGTSAASPATSTIAVSGGALSADVLRVGRWNDGRALQNTTNTFTQTAGSTSVTNLGLGSAAVNVNAAGPHIANLNLTGGTFSATSFASLSAGGAATVTNANSSFIHIGGTAEVTLGAFPTARGTNSTATITFDSGATGFLAPAAASTTYMPAGTFTNAYLTTNGANFNVATGKNITIGQVLQDAVSPAAAGTLTKSGAGTLTLTGVNSYTGATTVLDGILSLSSPALADSAPLTIGAAASSPAVLNLPNAGTDTVGSLIIDGVTQPNGLYDSTNSGGAITGLGKIQVGSADAYGSWASSFGLQNPWLGVDPALNGNPTGDPDADGTSNLLEFVLGGSPVASSSAILPSLTNVGSNLVLSYKRSDESESTTQIGQWSTDLATWTDVTPVLVNENGALSDDMTITVPNANAVAGKLFLRLNVVR
jgi:autotransporter-associated beta strand protein